MTQDVPRIFISYRREDSADVTGHIGEKLREHFGKESVFTDVDNIPLGVDFRSHIDDAVKQCDVLLAVIGKDWLSARNADGELRLDDPADFVRIEIESALKRDIPVIPLLVRGASIPQSHQLPDSIEELAFRNAQPIRPDPDFRNDVDRLIRSLVRHFEPDTPDPSREIPSASEQPGKSRPTGGQWRSRKLLWLGAFAGSAVAVVFLLAEVSQKESSEPDPSTNNSQLKLGRSTPTLETPDKDYIPPDMVKIPAGSFLMGSERDEPNAFDDEFPAHRVQVSAFEIGRAEVTWGEWRLCESAGACLKLDRPTWLEDDNDAQRHPVVYVSQKNALTYIAWLSEVTGTDYRLPSEAEWEYAARAGSRTQYSWGNDIGEGNANCNGCEQTIQGETTPVGHYAANPWELQDMHGNVREWAADCWHDEYTDAPDDGSAWINDCSEADTAVLRGGSWVDRPEILRAACRNMSRVRFAYNTVGFRLARTLP